MTGLCSYMYKDSVARWTRNNQLWKIRQGKITKALVSHSKDFRFYSLGSD